MPEIGQAAFEDKNPVANAISAEVLRARANSSSNASKPKMPWEESEASDIESSFHGAMPKEHAWIDKREWEHR